MPVVVSCRSRWWCLRRVARCRSGRVCWWMLGVRCGGACGLLVSRGCRLRLTGIAPRLKCESVVTPTDLAGPRYVFVVRRSGCRRGCRCRSVCRMCASTAESPGAGIGSDLGAPFWRQRSALTDPMVAYKRDEYALDVDGAEAAIRGAVSAIADKWGRYPVTDRKPSADQLNTLRYNRLHAVLEISLLPVYWLGC